MSTPSDDALDERLYNLLGIESSVLDDEIGRRDDEPLLRYFSVYSAEAPMEQGIRKAYAAMALALLDLPRSDNRNWALHNLVESMDAALRAQREELEGGSVG